MKSNFKGLSCLLAAALISASCGFQKTPNSSKVMEEFSTSVDESVLKENHAVRVNLQTNTATYYQKGIAIRSWQVASARGDGLSETPTGTFRFHELSVCQVWTSTRNNASFGPCDPSNPTGTRGLWFKTSEYGLHGVDEDHRDSVTTPDAEDRRQSSGCVRNSPEDIAWLTEQVAAEYGTTPAELKQFRGVGEEVILPATGKGVALIIGRWDASVDGVKQGVAPAAEACTAENATGRILSGEKIKVTTASGQEFDAQPFEEICPTSNVKNGKVEVFFPKPPAGFAFATVSKVGYCNIPKLNSCIKNDGGVSACTLRECKPK